MDWPINSLTFKSQHCLVCYLTPPEMGYLDFDRYSVSRQYCLTPLETGYLDFDRYPVSSITNNTSSLQQSPACTPALATFIGKHRFKGYRHRPKTLTIMDKTYDGSELTDFEQICLFDASNFFLSIKEKDI